jgi:hypothetical protein
VQGGLTLALWVAVLIVSIAVVRSLPSPPLLLKWWEAFYRIGSIIYGGGQVGWGRRRACQRTGMPRGARGRASSVAHHPRPIRRRLAASAGWRPIYSVRDPLVAQRLAPLTPRVPRHLHQQPDTLAPLPPVPQVVLPMLYTEVVQQNCDARTLVCTDRPDTWVTSKQFYAGLGIVQALPGPLFNFSAYLGAIMAINSGHVFIVGTLLAWFGLFMPGILVGGWRAHMHTHTRTHTYTHS